MTLPLTELPMTQAMEAIVSGKADDADIEAFLLALKEKGETVEEIVSAACVMRKHALRLSKNYPELVDTCGTGGDHRNTLNISTAAALVACSAGARIGKHGNRSVSSVCGSADLLEGFGVRIDPPVFEIEKCIETTGFGFFFAPIFHPATRFAIPARKRIKGKTIFNLLGPLCNPAGAERQLLGVYDKSLVDVMAKALKELGSKRALVVHGRDGLDEISTSDETTVAELKQGNVKTYKIAPEDFGIPRAALSALQCSSKEECKIIAEKTLKGEPGPASDIVCLNAGAALYVAGKAASIKEGVSLSRKTIESGTAYHKLNEIINFLNTNK